jgi:FkbM family methyltransferase
MGESIKTNVFLDLGTHSCQGLTHFIQRELKADSSWEIHTFEPNPLLDPTECVKALNLDITLHREAVWVNNGTVIFGQYGPDGTSQGSLVRETKGDKHYRDYHSETEVNCIDFVEFVNSFRDREAVFIKMDIEWSEYLILRKMLETGWSDNIKKIWVEFHDQNQELNNELIDAITQSGTAVDRWI